MNPLSTFVGR